jgi:RNA-directed DNA polymerase
VVSPLLSNVHLTEVDIMLERAKAATRDQQETRIDYARFADDLVVLVGAHPRQRWLRTAVERRLREELAKFLVEVNEEKSRRVDLTQDERFGFLGFEFRRIRTGGADGCRCERRKARSGRHCCGRSRQSFGALAPGQSQR